MIEYTLSSPARPEASRILAKAALGILAEYVLDKEILYNFDLALTEACANVVRHAYPDGAPTADDKGCATDDTIEIAIAINPKHSIQLTVSDYGCGFGNLPRIIRNAGPEEEGGRGLYIISQLTDAFELRTCDGRNSVHLLKYIEESQWRT